MISVIIPFREDTPHRRRCLEHVAGLWSRLPVELVVEEDHNMIDDFFSYGRLANRAARRATSPNILLWGADHIPPDWELLNLIILNLQIRPWVAPYSRTLTIDQMSTRQRLKRRPLTALSFSHTAEICMGVLGVRLDAFQAIGGFDERFIGWGYEDTELRHRLLYHYGPGAQGDHDLQTLWHPPAPTTRFHQNEQLYLETTHLYPLEGRYNDPS